MNSSLKKNEIGQLHLQTILKVEDSSRIVRMTLVFLVFACIVLFIGWWNSLNISWLESRIKMHEYQLYWYKNIVNDKAPNNLSTKETILFQECKDYYNSKHYTKAILIAELGGLNEAKLNNTIFIKIPIFNVTFDVNDLGLIGGFGITIIYFLLLYSLINRYNQLDNVFHLIKKLGNKIEKESAYYMLSMDQILTLPRKGIIHYKVIRLIPRFLYFIPILVLLAIFINDIITFDIGYYYLNSLGKVMAIYAASLVFLFLSITQAIWCLIIVIKTNDLWEKNYPKKQFPNE